VTARTEAAQCLGTKTRNLTLTLESLLSEAPEKRNSYSKNRVLTLMFSKGNIFPTEKLFSILTPGNISDQ
jgi:hypothetical protein